MECKLCSEQCGDRNWTTGEKWREIAELWSAVLGVEYGVWSVAYKVWSIMQSCTICGCLHHFISQSNTVTLMAWLLQHFSAETKQVGLGAGFRPPFSGIYNICNTYIYIYIYITYNICITYLYDTHTHIYITFLAYNTYIYNIYVTHMSYNVYIYIYLHNM